MIIARLSEQLEHLIRTINERDLTKRLMILRLRGTDGMEETLRKYQGTEC